MLPFLIAAQIALLQATEVRRVPADEAHQGVVTDARHLYAISDSAIGQYDRATGRRVGLWRGDPALFRHMNSCALVGARLVCAASNYPDVPSASAVEWFSTAPLKHVATHSFGPGRGSLTWINWHDGSWWACFANYDLRGTDPGRDHKWTVLVRFDATFAERGSWLFPADVLERFAPRSASGGTWGDDGLLYVTGHDRPELYALRVPEAGPVLQHVATIAIPTDGQAIAWDARDKRILWSIERTRTELVASRVPPLP